MALFQSEKYSDLQEKIHVATKNYNSMLKRYVIKNCDGVTDFVRKTQLSAQVYYSICKGKNIISSESICRICLGLELEKNEVKKLVCDCPYGRPSLGWAAVLHHECGLSTEEMVGCYDAELADDILALVDSRLTALRKDPNYKENLK